MEEEEAELRNPFPSPPSHYNNYTSHNLELLRLLRERVGDGDPSQANQHEILSDQTDVPDWSLTQLEKPRVDWILEEGQYSVFGDTWFVRIILQYASHMSSSATAGEGDYSLISGSRWTPAVPSRSQRWYAIFIFLSYVCLTRTRPAPGTVNDSEIYSRNILPSAERAPRTTTDHLRKRAG